MASKYPERYFVSHRGNEVIIETENTKEKTILDLLSLLIQELERINPKLYERFYEQMSILRNRYVAQKDESETQDDDDSFEFYEKLMQSI